MIAYQYLSPSQTADYAAMTYARYRPYLAQEGNAYVRFVPIGASLAGQPVGLLIGQVIRKNQQGVLLSMFTAPPMRNQGIASGLVAAYEAWLHEQGSPAVSTTYTTVTKSLPIVEHVLTKNGWSAPERLTSVVYIPTNLAAYHRFTQTPMGQLGCDLPDGYHYVAWLEISPAEKDALRARIEQIVPVDENPFLDDSPIDPSSIAILHDGQIIAWMVNHRLAPQRLRFSFLYLNGEHRGHKLGVKLVNEAVRRALLPFTDEKHQETFLFQTRLGNDVMQFYIQAIGAVVSQIEELRLMKKDL